MHDVAPCYKAKGVQEYLNKANVTILGMPGNSPDLNHIRNLWDSMKNMIAKMMTNSQPANTQVSCGCYQGCLGPEILAEFCQSYNQHSSSY